MTQPTGSTNQPTPPGRPVTPGRTQAVGWVFYAVVLAVALTGASTSAAHWLHWLLPFAVAAVGAVELGGVYLSVHADERRRLGERALVARLLSAAVATGAVAVNYLGHVHDNQGQAVFFAGMSALGYTVWLIHSSARRRDWLRAARMLPEVPPAYPLAQWLRHPWLTRRARALAVADPTLGLHGSLTAARAAARTERRRTAIASVLRRKIEASADATTAEIAVTVFDLDEIANRLASGADYDALTNLLAVDLDPVRLLGDQPPVAVTNQPDPAVRSERTKRPNRAGEKPEPTRGGRRQPDRRPEPRPNPLHVVGEPAAVANARHLRSIYPIGLPDTERAIRTRTGWSKVRVEKAVEAYRAGADQQTTEPDQSDDDQEREPARELIGAGA